MRIATFETGLRIIWIKKYLFSSFLDDSNAQHGQGSSEDSNGGRTLFAIIPQQQLAEGATLDPNTINTLLNIANDQEKLSTNPQGSLLPTKLITFVQILLVPDLLRSKHVC
jgi:hypothetical protein